MAQPASLRVLAALLLILATIVFVIGVIAERSVAAEPTATGPSEPVTASSSEQSEEASREGTDTHAESGAAEGTGEDAPTDAAAQPHTETNETREPILGIDLESTSVVAAAVAISLLLAAALWYWGTPTTLVVAGAVALLFAALDVREVAHQLSEGRSSLVVVALLAALLHVGAAMVAGLALTRRGAAAGAPSLP